MHRLSPAQVLRLLAAAVPGLLAVSVTLREPLVADHPHRGVDWYLAKTRVVVRTPAKALTDTNAPATPDTTPQAARHAR